MSDRSVRLPGVLGGDDSPDFDEVDTYIAALEDASGMPEVVGEWMTRNRALALCKRYGHDDESYAGSEENGPYLECRRCGDRMQSS